VGLLLSPFTPGYVADRHQLQLFADIGVVLLLFEVGIEIDPLKVGRDKRHFVWVVPLHTVATAVAAALVGIAAGLEWRGAAILGVSIALSSSVVVVNITRSRRRTTSEQTKHALLGWSVVQDVTGVALAAAVISTLGLQGRPLWLAILGIAAYGGVAVLAAAALPHVLRQLTDQRDLFLLCTVANCQAPPAPRRLVVAARRRAWPDRRVQLRPRLDCGHPAPHDGSALCGHPQRGRGDDRAVDDRRAIPRAPPGRRGRLDARYATTAIGHP
jgi:hypothetical protein